MYELIDELPHPDALHRVRVSPDGSWLATTCSDKGLRIFDAKTREEKKKWSVGVGAAGLAFSSDRRTIVAGAKSLIAYDLSNLKKLGSMKGHRNDVHDAVFAPDGTTLISAAGSQKTPADWSVRTWDVGNLEEKARSKLGSPVRAIAVDPIGRIAAGCDDGSVSLLDVEGETLWRTKTPKQIYCLKFSLDGKKVYAAGDDRFVTVLEAKSGHVVSAVSLDGVTRQFTMTREGLIFAALNPSIMYSYERLAHVGIFDADSGRELARLPPIAEMLKCIAIGPDAQQIFVAATEGKKHWIAVYARS